jgi:hypothetical protein
MYGNASNAKVNIQKTEMVSLSGEPHSDWIPIAAYAGISWHDKSSSSAVRYLGYPLYSNEHQLLSYLDVIKTKITKHAHILSSRSLSIRGSSLVANSLLLSKLWHILRVVTAPTKWLDQLRTIILEFICPFWPAPSWSTLWRPKKYGVGVVDIHNQAHALHIFFFV